MKHPFLFAPLQPPISAHISCVLYLYMVFWSYCELTFLSQMLGRLGPPAGGCHGSQIIETSRRSVLFGSFRRSRERRLSFRSRVNSWHRGDKAAGKSTCVLCVQKVSPAT